MKAVILAGGLGTRIQEETHLKPKPMIEIGGKPILWHILKMYSSHGINDFIVCCGHKGYVIKEYFANYFLHMSDITFDISSNEMSVHKEQAEPWKVTLIDTGENTLTGGRLKRVYEYIKEEEAFCFTYGDGLSDVDITKLIKFHKEHGKKATLTAVLPSGRFGALKITDNSFVENIAAIYACKSAIKAGDPLKPIERRSLIDGLFATEHPYYCPHGRPIIINLSIEDLDERFERH